MQILPTVIYETCPPLDLIMVPGGPGQQKLMEDEATSGFSSGDITSVCTGSPVLGAPGLLKGKRATCHWSAFEHLKFLGATPVSERVVVDGNIITGAGVTFGIEFGLGSNPGR